MGSLAASLMAVVGTTRRKGRRAAGGEPAMALVIRYALAEVRASKAENGSQA